MTIPIEYQGASSIQKFVTLWSCLLPRCGMEAQSSLSDTQ